MASEDLGAFVKEARESKRWTQRDLAKKSGMSPGYISMLERGVNSSTGLPLKPTAESLRAVSDALGLSYMELLRRAGLIDPKSYEHIRPVPAQESVSVRVPFYGRVGCGEPVDITGEPVDYLPMESFAVREGQVVVQACGDSMDQAGIQDGDYLVIEPATTAAPGKIVIANLEGLGCTCKRLSAEAFKGGRVWWLNPESSNPDHSPHLLGPGDRIVGVVKGMYRSL